MTEASVNQANKAVVWDYWQKLNHVPTDQLAEVVRAAVHEGVNWNGSAPIDQLVGVDALITGFGDRERSHDPDHGRVMGLVGEGHYAMGGIWDVVFSDHNGHLRRHPGHREDPDHP